MDEEKKGICFLDRRDFMKTAAVAVVGSTLSCAGIMIEGNYMNEIADILFDENIDIIGPLNS